MYHSLIGKPPLRVGLMMGLLIGLSSLLLLAACGGEEAAKGGAGGEHKKGTGSFAGTASTDGLMVFRRYLDYRDLTKSAIFTMYPNGSHIRQITHPPKGFSDGSPAWSPDGMKVAFQRQAIDERRRCPLCSRTSWIMVLNTKTGDARQVVEGVEGFDPAFSPDGHSLAFRRPAGIWIVELDGSNPHQVTNVQKRGALEFEDFGPAFSPDGKRLVFERVRVADDDSAVFVQSLNSSGSPEDARQITPWEMGCGEGPEFSPNGDWVLFSCAPEDEYEYVTPNLYMVHPDGTGWLGGTGMEQLTRTPFNSPDDVHYVGSSFSPEFKDGGKWAEGWGDIVGARYPAYGSEGNSDVFRMHVEHGVQATVNLTKSETLDDDPSWGTHPPSLKSLYKRGCDPVPKEPDEASKCY